MSGRKMTIVRVEQTEHLNAQHVTQKRVESDHLKKQEYSRNASIQIVTLKIVQKIVADATFVQREGNVNGRSCWWSENLLV